MEAEEVTFELLEEITDSFSEDRKLGEGAFGAVYRGVTKNGKNVAVKRLHDVNLDGEQFQNEFNNLSMLKHPNTVQVLGYCYETKRIPREFNGMTVLAEEIHRALCLEYLPNGSLEKHLADELHGFDWHIRYKIVKGTCEGLKYLHNRPNPIYHLDLKPDNILLDKELVPKIADFGLSMMIRKEQTWSTQSRLGTLGYQPPEHIEKGEISNMFDIFSLGVVMIKILSGDEGYSKCADMSSEKFIDLVQNNWKDRLEKTWSGILLDAYCKQVKTCIEISLKCVEKDSGKRPDIVKIINKLNEVEALIPKETCTNIVAKDNSDQIQHFESRTSSRSDGQEFIGVRETSPYIGELIVGRADEKEKIIASLLENKMQKIILPIHGIGGIGKTTFAKLIYDNFKGHTRVWVYVSQTFDLKKIGNCIISQLSEKDSQAIAELDDVVNHLKNLLFDKKVLIVLDDLWEDNPFELGRLKDMLSLGDRNNTIVLVTTRSEQIAKKICMNHEPYQIEALTEEICWEIIKQKCDFDARYDSNHLENIGKNIASKCSGLALAAQSVGFMLKSMSSHQWEEVNQSMLNDATCINGVLPSLKLSYDSLTEPLQTCFTYCGIFPKGHIISKDKLAYQWISLGFIKPTRLLSTLQLCDKYIMQLLGLSFLQPTNERSYDEDAIMYTMHDLVHDLARSIIADEILDSTKEYNTGKGKSRGCIPRYACVTDCTKSLELHTSLEKIRAITCQKYVRIELRDEALSSATSLQVLDLSQGIEVNLPDSLGQLKQLRYLSAPWSDCITKLTNLVYLNLTGCSMKALPASIGELKDLWYLDISGCEEIIVLPKTFSELKRLVHLDLSQSCRLLGGRLSILAGLTNLQYLDLSISDGGALDVSTRNISNEDLQVIANLTELRYLNLSGISLVDRNCSDVLTGIKMSLPKCRVKMDELQFPDDIRFFVHADYDGPTSNIVMLKHSDPEWLEIMELEHVKSVKEVESIELRKKERITHLDLSWYGRDSERSVEDVQVLEELLPSSALRELVISGYNSMSFPDWLLDVVHYLPNLVTIELSCLRECKNLPPLGQLPNLESLCLEHMDRITSIDQGFCGGVGAFPKLMYFGLSYMENLEAWSTAYSHGDDDVVEFMFPMLRSLSISGCPKLMMKPCPPRASEWRIHSSDNVLLSSCETLGGTCPSSEAERDVIVTVHSTKLPMERWTLFRYLPANTTLRIEDYDGVTGNSTELIKSLILSGWSATYSFQFPSWLGNLPSLEKLTIEKCKGVEVPLESVKKLTALRVLRLSKCGLETLPEWLRELISLQELILEECESIRVLPLWLDDLASLQKLEIYRCHIVYWPKSILKRKEAGQLVIHRSN